MGHLRCRLQRPAQQARSFWCRLVFRTDPSQIRNEKHLRAYSYNYLNEERSNYYGDNGDDHMGCHGEQPGPAPGGSAGRSGNPQEGVQMAPAEVTRRRGLLGAHWPFIADL